MAFTCLSDSLHMTHAGTDGLHVMEAACEKVYPFDVTSSALPVFDVLHLKEKQIVYEFLRFLEITLSLLPRLV